VQLGADGTLPELVLEEVEPDAAGTRQQSKSSNPMFLIGVLSASVVSSVLLLLLDAESTTRGDGPADARHELARHYIRGEPLAEYQVLLRRALQQHAQGNLAEERRLYHRVLDMLHREDQNRFTGLTGAVDAADPPNDRDLERLLARLLEGG